MPINAAPGELETVREFVNTFDVEIGQEELTTPATLAAWLHDHGLADRPPQLGQPELDRSIELREALRAAFLANAGVAMSPAAVKALNRTLSDATLALRFAPDGQAALQPARSGLDEALGRLAAIVQAAIQDDSWRRLKVCTADDCQWAFYDRSRNRSGHWCDMAVCGNRSKVRAFRERQAGSRA